MNESNNGAHSPMSASRLLTLLLMAAVGFMYILGYRITISRGPEVCIPPEVAAAHAEIDKLTTTAKVAFENATEYSVIQFGEHINSLDARPGQLSFVIKQMKQDIGTASFPGSLSRSFSMVETTLNEQKDIVALRFHSPSERIISCWRTNNTPDGKPVTDWQAASARTPYFWSCVNFPT